MPYLLYLFSVETMEELTSLVLADNSELRVPTASGSGAGGHFVGRLFVSREDLALRRE
jgi:hypothetical protein